MNKTVFLPLEKVAETSAPSGFDTVDYVLDEYDPRVRIDHLYQYPVMVHKYVEDFFTGAEGIYKYMDLYDSSISKWMQLKN